MEYKQEENPYHILAYHETKRPIASREEDTNVTKLLNILVVTPNDMEKLSLLLSILNYYSLCAVE